MKHIPATPLTTHLCARLIAWGRLMLVWLSAVMFADRRASRRQMRTRYPMCDANRFASYIGNLILMRALADKPHLRAQGLLLFHEGTGPLCTHVKARAMYRKSHLDEYFESQISEPRRSSSEPRRVRKKPPPEC